MNGDKDKLVEIDGDPISGILGGLPHVEAPLGFENAVKRRIALGPRSSRSAGFAFLKIAIPAAALGALALFFGLSGYLSNDIPSIAVERELDRPIVDYPTISGDVAATENQTPRIEANQDQAVATKRQTNSLRDKGSNAETDGGSSDLGANSPSREVLPKGLNPDSRPSLRAPGIGEISTVRLVEVISFSGIKADFQQRGLVVNSVVENSPAKRAGVQSGDIVEAINDVLISRSATIRGGVDLRTIRVRRNGQSLTFKF